MPNYIFLCQGDFLLPPFGRPLPGVILDSVVQWAAPIVMHLFICSFIHSSIFQDLLWYHLVQPQHHSPRLMQLPPPSLLASALAPHVLLSTQQPE